MKIKKPLKHLIIKGDRLVEFIIRRMCFSLKLTTLNYKDKLSIKLNNLIVMLPATKGKEEDFLAIQYLGQVDKVLTGQDKVLMAQDKVLTLQDKDMLHSVEGNQDMLHSVEGNQDL